jgi:hypothetical protein
MSTVPALVAGFGGAAGAVTAAQLRALLMTGHHDHNVRSGGAGDGPGCHRPASRDRQALRRYAKEPVTSTEATVACAASLPHVPRQPKHLPRNKALQLLIIVVLH